MMIDVLVLGRDELLVGDRVAGHPLVLRREVVHREVDAPEVAAGDLQVARVGRPGAEADGVEVGQELLGGDVAADVHARLEDHPLGLHLGDPAVDVVLLHLEVGDAVAEQAADPVVALEDDDVVPGAGELLGDGQAGGAGADHGDLLAGLDPGRLGDDPALLPARLTMLSSICLIATGSSIRPRTQADSHGAGQSLPVNSGKLLVACSRSIAAFHWSR